MEDSEVARIKGEIKGHCARYERAADAYDRVDRHMAILDVHAGTPRLSPTRTTIAMVGPGRYIHGDTVEFAPSLSADKIGNRNIAYLSRSNGRKAQGAKFGSQRKPREREAVERTDVSAHTATAVAGPMAVVDDLRSARDEARRVWGAYGTTDPSRWRRWARRHAFPLDYFTQVDTGPMPSAPVYQDAQEFAIILARLSDR